MRLPFGSRSVDDYGDDVDDGIDGSAYDDGAIDLRHEGSYRDRNLDHDDEADDEDDRPPVRRGFSSLGRAFGRRRPDGDLDPGDPVRFRDEASAEQRSAWAYLGALGVLALATVGFGYGCSDQRAVSDTPVAIGELMTDGQPTRLVFRISGDVVTLEGAVPDEAARSRVIEAAQATYGPENVVDELVVDADSTLEAGTLRVIGSAAVGDARPETLQQDVLSSLGLSNRGFEVGFVNEVLAPVAADVTVDNDRVRLTGTLPDSQAVADFSGLADEVWGGANVDASGLAAGETTWEGGVVRLTGTTTSSDLRIGSFVEQVPLRFGSSVVVDTVGLTIADDQLVLADVQTRVNDLVTADPIQFEPTLADLTPESDAVLTEVAAVLNEQPTAQLEVVGHTDDVGDEQENQALSEDRAEAVVDRLAQLGVDRARMTFRGEGESTPIADNSTDEGRAQNRRIEFVLVGAN